MAQSQSKNSSLNKRNPIAKSLKNKIFKQTIINSRKGDKNEIIKELQSSRTN